MSIVVKKHEYARQIRKPQIKLFEQHGFLYPPFQLHR